MTVNTLNITSGPYSGNDVADQFSYTFRIEEKDQLRVFETNASGDTTELTVDTDYTVAGIGDDGGGTLTRSSGPLPSGFTWFIRSNYIPTQDVAFGSQGGFFPEVHEGAFDKTTFLIQQLYDLNNRNLKISPSEPLGANLEIPSNADRAGKVLTFGLDGGVEVEETPTDLLLRQELSSSPSTGKGASLVNGAAIYVGSVAELEALSLPTGAAVRLTQDGRAGSFLVKSGTPPSDPQKGVYIPLANGNYAVRQFGQAVTLYPEVNALWFGATGDGTTDNLIPLQAAINFDGATSVYVPPADDDYITSAQLVVDREIWIRSDKQPRAGSPGATIRNTGTGNTILWSDTKVLYDCGIKDIELISTSGGSPISIKYGAARCKFLRLRLYSKPTNRACVSANFIGGVLGTDYVGIYSCIFEGGEYIVDNVPRTAGIIDLFADGTMINENQFRNFWMTQSNGRHAFRLTNISTSSVLTNNSLDNITFEVCSGGLISLAGTSHTALRNISAWDTPAGYNSDLILVQGGTGIQTRGLLIENFARLGSGDQLNGGAVDINLGNSRDTTIIGFSTSNADAVINASGRTAVIIGQAAPTMLNDGSVTYLNGSEVAAKRYVTKAGNLLRDSAQGNINVEAPDGNAGFVATNVSESNTQRVFLDPSAFFGGNGAFLPNSDAALNLGHTTNRFKTVYASNGTINTSDSREKQQDRLISEAEESVALEIKGLIKAFKWNRDVIEKGDSAEWQFGVIAQQVVSAFEKHGLDADDYGMLSHESWPEKKDPATGEITPAGDLYGVRYEQLLAFIVAAI